MHMAIFQLKAGKAAGVDAIYPEILIHAGKRTRTWLAKFFTDLLERKWSKTRLLPPNSLALSGL